MATSINRSMLPVWGMHGHLKKSLSQSETSNSRKEIQKMSNSVLNDSGFTPTGDLVLILPPPPEKKTAGGIVLTANTLKAEAQATRYGTVLAMGETAGRHPRMTGIDVGDQVLFPRYGGDEFPVKGVSYFIMRAENIFGKMEKAPDYALNAAISNLEAFPTHVSAA